MTQKIHFGLVSLPLRAWTQSEPPRGSGGVRRRHSRIRGCVRLRFLWATSVFSVSRWCVLLRINQPQTHSEHRGCTEKSAGGTFRAKPESVLLPQKSDSALGSGQYHLR